MAWLTKRNSEHLISNYETVRAASAALTASSRSRSARKNSRAAPAADYFMFPDFYQPLTYVLTAQVSPVVSFFRASARSYVHGRNHASYRTMRGHGRGLCTTSSRLACIRALLGYGAVRSLRSQERVFRFMAPAVQLANTSSKATCFHASHCRGHEV